MVYRVSLPILLFLFFNRLDLSNCSLAHIKDIQEASTALIMYEIFFYCPGNCADK